MRLKVFCIGVTVFNNLAWLLYAILTKDYYLFFTAAVGFNLGVFYTVSSLTLLSKSKSLSDSDIYFRLEALLMSGSIFFCCMGMYVGITLTEFEMELAKSIVAYVGVTLCTAYYASPCTVIAHILKTKNSSTLYAPMVCANLANSILWLLYGLSLGDVFVYGPNVFGISLSVLQLFLICVYNNSPPKDEIISDDQEERSLLL